MLAWLAVTGNGNDIEENHLDYIAVGETANLADAAKFEHNILKNNSGHTQLIVKGVGAGPRYRDRSLPAH